MPRLLHSGSTKNDGERKHTDIVLDSVLSSKRRSGRKHEHGMGRTWDLIGRAATAKDGQKTTDTKRRAGLAGGEHGACYVHLEKQLRKEVNGNGKTSSEMEK